ncbi:anionic trypsin-2 [Monomorium pharaonis]|uniref:anionic trypsin-2 n=1 Tax=Monomorium pharaonis TaxID=307658 RepID=UPI001746FA35|nr:anionic trypsin-2 [Monomorium pharaonis]
MMTRTMGGDREKEMETKKMRLHDLYKSAGMGESVTLFDRPLRSKMFGLVHPGFAASFVAVLLIFEVLFTPIQAEYTNLADVPCGRSEMREARIVGGHDAAPREFPWMVGLKRKGGHFCGGVIVNDRIVLSAAHCLCSATNKRIPEREVRVILGAHNISDPAARYELVKKAMFHPGHTCGKFVDDIVLLELARPISWSESVKPACLPMATGQPGYSAFNDVDALVTGWGYLVEDTNQRKKANVLQKVEVRVINNTRCGKWFADQGKKVDIGTNQMCAGWEKGGKDACWADSGGPLMVGSHSAEPLIVVGIVSGSFGCARPRLPGVYTRNSYYVDWIIQKIKSSRYLKHGKKFQLSFYSKSKI